MLRGFVIKLRQLIVLLVLSVFVLSAQAAFVVGMSPAQIRAESAAQQAAGIDVAAVVASAAAASRAAAVNATVQQAVAATEQLLPPSVPLATPTTQTLCSVSCS